MLSAFTYRDFRVQWFGACTSSIGTWMQIVAQNWLVLSLTHSTFYLGLDAFLQQLPMILFSLIGGVLADRLDLRRTLITSQYVQMATSATLSVLMYFGAVQIWHVLALSFLTGMAQAFGGPAYQTLIPSLVDKKDLPNAIALNSIQFNLARVLGPLLFLVMLVPFTVNGLAVREAFFVDFLGRLDVGADPAFATGFLFSVMTLVLAAPGLAVVLWESIRRAPVSVPDG